MVKCINCGVNEDIYISDGMSLCMGCLNDFNMQKLDGVEMQRNFCKRVREQLQPGQVIYVDEIKVL